MLIYDVSDGVGRPDLRFDEVAHVRVRLEGDVVEPVPPVEAFASPAVLVVGHGQAVHGAKVQRNLRCDK